MMHCTIGSRVLEFYILNKKSDKNLSIFTTFFLENLRKYLYQAIKDNIEFNLELNSIILANVV